MRRHTRNPKIRPAHTSTYGRNKQDTKANYAAPQNAAINKTQLPVEILSMIFTEAIHVMGLPLFHPGCIQHNPGWFVLLWICTRWRNVLIADASIWAACYSHYPKLQSTFIARAGLVPLVYKLTASEPHISPYTGMFRTDESVLARFFAETPLNRCAEVYVSDGRGNPVTDYIFELAAMAADRPLEHLRRLHLETWHWNWTGWRANILAKGLDSFAIVADKLEDVQLNNCWTIVSSPMLKRLAILFSTNHLPRPDIHVFYRAMKISGGHTLTHLELANPVGGSYRDDIRRYEADPVTLSSLTYLSVVGYAPHVANILRIIQWPRQETKLLIRTVVGDGPEHSLADEESIMNICFPAANRIRARVLSVEHIDHSHIADRTVIRVWSDEWRANDEQRQNPDATLSFGGAYMPCLWYETATMAAGVCGGASIQSLILALLPGDYHEANTPWERLFLSLPSLGALFPRRRVLDDIGPVPDDHTLGIRFRRRVRDLEGL